MVDTARASVFCCVEILAEFTVMAPLTNIVSLYSQHELASTSIIKYGMKLPIRPQTSTVASLQFGNGTVI